MIKNVRLLKIALLITVFVLAACAPEDLDITPSATPTEVPTATPTLEPGATTEDEPIQENLLLLDHLLDSFPDTIPADLQWHPTADEVVYRDREGGVTGTKVFDEGGGGLAEITIGVFDSPEAALAHWEWRTELRTLEHSEGREEFPLPNAFGSGAYGSDAIWIQDNIFVRLSVPRFPSNSDPLGPLGNEILEILEEALASYEPPE